MKNPCHRIRLLPAAALLATMLLSGCATRGYVNDRIDAMRDADAAELANLRNSTEQAMERARLASDSAAEARALALGRAGLEEIGRYTVRFAFDSDALRESERSTLRDAVAAIEAHPEAIVDVYGFADPTGSDRYNLELGERRAMEVVRHLAAATPNQLNRYAAVSFGERGLAGMTTANDAPGQNRKVVVSLLRRVPMDETEASSTAALAN